MENLRHLEGVKQPKNLFILNLLKRFFGHFKITVFRMTVFYRFFGCGADSATALQFAHAPLYLRMT